jgi:RNA polymerase sigma factor (sigma-70 family)
MALPSDDLNIWNSFKSGSHQSFELIYRNEFNFLVNYGKTITPDEQTIGDCIQELFIELWNRRETIGLTDNIRSYLLVSFRRKLIKNMKDTYADFADEYITDKEVSNEEKLIYTEEQNEKHSILNQSMNELSKKQKEIIHLKFFQNLDYEDIAKIMEINYQSCRNLVSGALKKLEENVKSQKINHKN